MDSLVDNMKQEDIKKLTKKKNSGLLIGLILLLVSLVLAFVTYKCLYSKECKSYYELGISGEDKEGTYAYIDLDSCQSFATETVGTEEYDYYYAIDTNGMLYIICMTEDKFDEIYDQYNLNPNEFFYRFTGYLYEAPDDLKQYACEMLQECFELDYSVGVDEYDDYFLSTYLDGSRSQYSSAVGFLAAATFVIFGIGLCLVIVAIFKGIVKATSGENNNIKLVWEDIEKCEEYFSDSGVVLTDNYLANTYKNPVAIKYEELLMIYRNPTILQGKTYYQIVCCTRKKNYVFGLFESENRVDEVIEMIQKHNSEVLVGYTRENIAQFEQLRKNK